jgi:hypothetical protein
MIQILSYFSRANLCVKWGFVKITSALNFLLKEDADGNNDVLYLN